MQTDHSIDASSQQSPEEAEQADEARTPTRQERTLLLEKEHSEVQVREEGGSPQRKPILARDY